MRKKVAITDITDQYNKKATPGIGSLSRAENYKEKGHENEIAAAETIFNIFGGQIILLAEESFRTENPDYKWNGMLWDLKTPSKIKNLGKLIQKGLSQIYANPGGLIIDVSNIKEPLAKVEKAVEERIETSMRNKVDIIFLRRNAVLKVLQYRK